MVIVAITITITITIATTLTAFVTVVAIIVITVWFGVLVALVGAEELVQGHARTIKHQLAQDIVVEVEVSRHLTDTVRIHAEGCEDVDAALTLTDFVGELLVGVFFNADNFSAVLLDIGLYVSDAIIAVTRKVWIEEHHAFVDLQGSFLM